MRTASLVLTFLLSVALAACSGGTSTDNPQEDLKFNFGDASGSLELVTEGVGVGKDGLVFDQQAVDTTTEPTPQCDPGEGCFLDPCTENGQCNSSWCVEHKGAAVCTQNCVEECPAGWACKQVGEGGPDVTFVCVSDFANLCKPCSAAADCTSVAGAEDACIAYDGEGSFCGGACGGEKTCPGGFTCQAATTVDGVELEQCVSTSGICSCTDKSVQLGLWTPCDTSNEFGSCQGKRVCTQAGLTACDATEPQQETCNGQDDDCDELTDEPLQEGGDFVHLCDDENDCTEDVCNGAEGCGHINLTGTACNAPDPCSSQFSCVDGACTGEAISCDDGKVCTVDSCDPVDGHCSHEAKDENCPSSNNPCVGTVFCDPFADGVTDPDGDGCVVIYKPEGTGCNDSDACTSGETCKAVGANLLCQGEPIDLDDGNPCTNDSCDPEQGPVHDAIPDCQAPCAPGEVMTGSCGKCGVHSKTCPDTGKWSDAQWGPCGGEGECLPGEQGSLDCGNCGIQTRDCLEGCQWSQWSGCQNEGDCTPGDTQNDACEGECTSKQRSCSQQCLWGEWGQCQQFGECTPGQVDNGQCGMCGAQKRTCSNLCIWGNWTNCAGEGNCPAGEQLTEDCGNCGTQVRNCSDTCQWGSWSGCMGEGPCDPNESQNQGCGNCGTQYRNCNNSCQWGSWSNCSDPCACDCNGGTCCSNGCDHDPAGTTCQGNPCKQCNSNGSCVNKQNGTNCVGGECNNGQCVECLTGQVEDCDPNCGVFSSPGDGEQQCVNNQWDDCKPIWCKGGPWPVTYQVAPNDHDWHCAYHQEFDIYLCVKVVLSWICADYLEFDLMKSHNVYGTDETGPWDNDLKVVVRNTNNGKTWTQNKVSCAGNTSTSGGCFFDVGTSTLLNTLDVSGTDSLEVDIYSPWTSPTPIGKTGKVKLKECF